MSEVRPPFLVHVPAAQAGRRVEAGAGTEGRRVVSEDDAMPCYRMQDDADDDADDEDDDEFYGEDDDEDDEDDKEEDDEEPETWQVTP